MPYINTIISKKKITIIFFSLALISSSIAYLNIGTFRESPIAEPFLLLLISGLLIIYITKGKGPNWAKFSELVYFLFVVYVIFKNTLTNTFEIFSLSKILFLLVLYYCFKSFLSKKASTDNSIILLSSFGIVLLTYLLIVVYRWYFEEGSITLLYIPNISIFSILLASQMAFVLPILLQKEKHRTYSKQVKWGMVLLIILVGLLFALTKGRAGWIGMMIALVYIACQNIYKIRLKKIFLLFAFPVFLLLTVSMFWYKPDSSGGRILIHKISANILEDNWLLGIGHGQFKIKYNEYQTLYFASHDINNKEALLADNTVYAFNDFFQGLIENGIIGFLLFTAAILFLGKQIKNVETTLKNKHLLTAAVASLVCIITGSLFSYPLQIFPILFQATLCISIINSFPSRSKQQINLPKKINIITKTTLALLSVLLFIHFCYYFNYKRKSNEAFELKRSGFKQQAMEKYQELERSYIKDGNTLYLYAQELYYSNQLIKSKEVLSEAKQHYSSNAIYKLSAAIEEDLKNYKLAEKEYKMAVYMVPNRMVSRKNLLDYYIRRKDTSNAIYWANSILNMPVKIPSEITRNIQKKTKNILTELSISK